MYDKARRSSMIHCNYNVLNTNLENRFQSCSQPKFSNEKSCPQTKNHHLENQCQICKHLKHSWKLKNSDQKFKSYIATYLCCEHIITLAKYMPSKTAVFLANSQVKTTSSPEFTPKIERTNPPRNRTTAVSRNISIYQNRVRN